MIKQDLDKRICDVDENATNTQTYREFMDETAREMGAYKEDFSKFTNKELTFHLDFCDSLWNK